MSLVLYENVKDNPLLCEDIILGCTDRFLKDDLGMDFLVWLINSCILHLSNPVICCIFSSFSSSFPERDIFYEFATNGYEDNYHVAIIGEESWQFGHGYWCNTKRGGIIKSCDLLFLVWLINSCILHLSNPVICCFWQL